MQAITKTPWFRPRKYLGWGWSPATWEGGLVTAVFVAALLANRVVFHFGVAGTVISLVLFLVVVVLTGGTPGGPTVLSRRRDS